MGKLIFLLLLTTVSNLAQAAWQLVEAMPDVTIYVDSTSVRNTGNQASMWILLNYKQAQSDRTGKKVLSDRVQYQFNCYEKQYQIIASSAHTGNMAGGEIVNITPDPPRLTVVAPGTMDETFWKRACGKTPTKKAK